MLPFIKYKSRTARRSRIAHIIDSTCILEQREIPSASASPVAALVGTTSANVHPQSNGPILDFSGVWKVDGITGLILDLSQNGKKVSGSLDGPGPISLVIHGKVDHGHLDFHGKGTWFGVSARLSFASNSTTISFGVLKKFGGTTELKLKGQDVNPGLLSVQH